MITNSECIEYFGISKSEFIPGLEYIPSALSENECFQILTMIEKNNWFLTGDQMIFFGNLPEWISPLIGIGSKMLSSIKRDPLFDQIIANSYNASQGIKPHIDLLKFDDGILIVSLTGTCTMEFSKDDQIISFFLRPGDAISLSGEARYKWMHGIPLRSIDVDENGRDFQRTHRISITLRSLRVKN